MTLSRIFAAAASAALIVSLPVAAQDKPQSQSGSSGSSAGTGSSSGARGSVPLQQQGQTRQQLFDKLDANSNGSISRAEAQGAPALIVIFVEADANADGELSSAEFGKVPLSNPDGSAAK